MLPLKTLTQYAKAKLRTIVALIAVVVFASFTVDKYFTLKFSEAALNKHFQNLSTIKKLPRRSNLPHQEVVFITSSIDSLQTDIINQVKIQSEAGKK